jgi:DNA-binding MarR family transcriptional regulator
MLFLPNKVRIRTYKAGLLQAKAYRALTNFMTSELAPYEISLPEWALLGLLHEHKIMRPSELSQAMGVKPPVVTANLKRLEVGGIIAREIDGDDSRVYTIKLTPGGEVRVETIEKSLRVSMREYFKDIKIVDLITYINVLNKLANKL